MGFPRQEYWSGLPFSSPGDLPDSGIEPTVPALAGGFFTTEPPRKPGHWGCLFLIFTIIFTLPLYWENMVMFKWVLFSLTLCNPMDYIVHGILQARRLERVAVPFSRGSSQPRDRTQVSYIAGGFFTVWDTRKTLGEERIQAIKHIFSIWFPLLSWSFLLLLWSLLLVMKNSHHHNEF